MRIKIIESIADIPAAQWDALAGNNPFLSHAYLCALQESGCATPDTGWHAQFLTLRQDDKLTGTMPLYFKTHSYWRICFRSGVGRCLSAPRAALLSQVAERGAFHACCWSTHTGSLGRGCEQN